MNIRSLGLRRGDNVLSVTLAGGKEIVITMDQVRQWLLAHPDATLRDVAAAIESRLGDIAQANVSIRCHNKGSACLEVIVSRPEAAPELPEPAEWA